MSSPETSSPKTSPPAINTPEFSNSDSGAAAPGGTESQQLELKSIHLPADVSTWPLAPGWWVLLALLLALLAAALLWHRRYKRQAFRREALTLLADIEKQQNMTPLQLIDDVSALLKRVAITTHGRESVAGRTGDSWLKFLDETGKTQGFTQGPGRILGANRFQPNIAIDAPALLALCRDWIQKQSC